MQRGLQAALPSAQELPRTRGELRERIIDDPVFFLETFCQVRDGEGRGIVLFRLNRPQQRYVGEVHGRSPARDIVGKSRKWGFTTLRCGLALHGVMYRSGRTARIIAQRQATSVDIAKNILRVQYETAVQFWRDIGEDPWYYLPRNTSDRRNT